MGTPVMARNSQCTSGRARRAPWVGALRRGLPRTAAAIALAALVAGCASAPEGPPPAPGQQAVEEDDSWWPSLSLFRVPKVHKIVVQQGNVITQQMIDRLKPGMTKAQAQYVLGRPALDDLFDPNRWVYIYIYQVPDYPEVRQTLTLYFENDALARFTSDLPPAPATTEATAATTPAPAAAAPAAPAAPTSPASGPPPGANEAAPLPPAATPAPADAETDEPAAATG